VVASEPAAPEPAAPGPEAEAARGHRAEPRRSDLLKQESALLTQARAQLRSGNAAGAQVSLDKLQGQFPNGMLAQERDVLAIEVLAARGNVDGARRRAKAFIKQYPMSPHSEKLRRFVE
jgi:outer membrane protein assembly factor BamD (BamD/ComL family)